MRTAITILTLITTLAALSYAGMGSVVTSWPDPLYNKVNGIAFDGEYIWLNNGAAETRGVLKCTTNGSLINEIGFPFHGWGPAYALAFDGAYLWTIFHQPVGLPISDHFAKYTTTGSLVYAFGTHNYNYYYPSIAVCWDGQYLWTDEYLRKQSKPDAGKYTTTGTVVGTFAVAGVWGTDAAYYNRQLWAGGDGYVYGMNIGASTLVASFDAPGGWAASTAFDGQYLWTIDRNEPQWVYKVDIDVVDVAPASVGRVKALYR